MAHQCMGCMKMIEDHEKFCSHCGYHQQQPMPNTLYLRPGTQINGYTFGRVLGHGGFGITYIGQHIASGEVVAIKEFFPSGMIGRTATQTVTAYAQKEDAFRLGLDKFRQEAQLIAQFKDFPGIVDSRDYFEAMGTGYFVMEYIEGITVKDYVTQQGGKIAFSAVQAILMPIMDALSEMHRHNIIHRDISPDNIYITKDKRVKLLDFGAARFANTQDNHSMSIILKHGYAPKEQYYTKSTQGPWTDVYAVAATAYFMLTGQIPQSCIERIEQDQLAPPSHIGSNIEGRQEQILMTALSLHEMDRYQTMVSFQQALLQATQINTPSSTAYESSGATSEDVRNHPTPAAVAHVESNESSHAASDHLTSPLEASIPQSVPVSSPPSQMPSSHQPTPAPNANGIAPGEPAAPSIAPPSAAPIQIADYANTTRQNPVKKPQQRRQPQYAIWIIAAVCIMMFAALVWGVTYVVQQLAAPREVAIEQTSGHGASDSADDTVTAAPVEAQATSTPEKDDATLLEDQYFQVIRLYRQEQYDQAAALLNTMPPYKDSDKYAYLLAIRYINLDHDEEPYDMFEKHTGVSLLSHESYDLFYAMLAFHPFEDAQELLIDTSFLYHYLEGEWANNSMYLHVTRSNTAPIETAYEIEDHYTLDTNVPMPEGTFVELYGSMGYYKDNDGQEDAYFSIDYDTYDQIRIYVYDTGQFHYLKRVDTGLTYAEEADQPAWEGYLEDIYQQAIKEYQQADYGRAIHLFNMVGSYKDSQQYAKLLIVHALSGHTLARLDAFVYHQTGQTIDQLDGHQLYQDILDMGNFEDARQILLSNYLIEYFLEGQWVTDGHDLTIALDAEKPINPEGPLYKNFILDCSMPRPDKLYHSFRDQIIYYANHSTMWEKAYRIEYINYDTIEVYVYQTDSTYTMKRKE